MLRALNRTIHRRTHLLRARPSPGLETGKPGRWMIDREGDREGANFALHGRTALPTRWVLLDLALRCNEEARRPRLLVDSGRGFADSTAVALPFPVEGHARMLLRLPDRVDALGLSFQGAAWVEIGDVVVREIGAPEAFARVTVPVVRERLAKPWDLPRAALKLIRALGQGGPRAVKHRLLEKQWYEPPQLRYAEWRSRYDTLTEADRATIVSAAARFSRKSLLSVVMPVHEPHERWLRAAVASVQRQLYPRWELCIAAEASTSPRIRALLAEVARNDPRIKLTLRESGGDVSATSNSALGLASGDYVVLLDPEDELTEHALFWLAAEVESHPGADLIYGDEDRLDDRGVFSDPCFKPDWNPDLFFSHNYLAHGCALRTTRVREAGGFRDGFEGSHDYDLCLRLTVGAANSTMVRHVPRVLYHHRRIEGATAPVSTAFSRAAQRALQERLDSAGARVEIAPLPGTHRVHWPVPQPGPLVSLIIPTRDGRALLESCVESLIRKTRYRNFELLVVDNQSASPDAVEYLRSLERRSAARVLPYDRPFNFSAINNFAVGHAKGELIGLLNNDVEIIEEGWLEEMVSHALRPEIGVVGARLLYPDRTLQHGGVILGIGGVANHAHKFFPADEPGYQSRAQLTQNFSAVTAACMVMRRSTYLAVGGLDETMAVAFNDVDFCLRVRETGLRNLWTPYATLLHHESKSRGAEDTRRKRARFRRETETLVGRWREAIRNDPAYNPNLTIEGENFTLAWPPRVPRVPAG